MVSHIRHTLRIIHIIYPKASFFMERVVKRLSVKHLGHNHKSSCAGGGDPTCAFQERN